LCTPGKTSRSVTHPEIASSQARLTSEFFAGGLLERKVYLDGISILSILLSLETGCHIGAPEDPEVGIRGSGAKKGRVGLGAEITLVGRRLKT
jgi:hypothetical protein